MATAERLSTLKKLLAEHNSAEGHKKSFLAYIDTLKDDKNSEDQLYRLYVKYHNLGIVIDGVNAVVAGRGMVLVTYHGYKNKVLAVYPEAKFDVQLVREGDEFNFAKESGGVLYSHSFGSPFEDKPIIGAYAVIATRRGDVVEFLNKNDYQAMKENSKLSGTWDKWPSEFWLKSVVKRACKRHFYDVVAEIDKVDNEDFGLAEEIKDAESKLEEIIAVNKKDPNDESTAR